jgi:hypothetical protein
MGKQRKGNKAAPLSGGLLRRMRQGAKKATGQGDQGSKKLSFWDILFWIVAGGAVLALLYRRFS